MFVGLFSLSETLKIHRLADERVLSMQNKDEIITVLEKAVLNENVLRENSSVILDYMNILESLIKDLNLELKSVEGREGEELLSIQQENTIKTEKQSEVLKELLRYIYLFNHSEEV